MLCRKVAYQLNPGSCLWGLVVVPSPPLVDMDKAHFEDETERRHLHSRLKVH